MRLTLFEEQPYQADQVRDKIKKALGLAPATRVEAAWTALEGLRIRRANVLDPAGSSPLSQADPEASDEDPPGDTIPLFRRTSTGGWVIAGLVGSCTLADSGLSVEVLPKTGRSGPGDAELPAARQQLLRMWQVAEGAPLNEHQAPAAAEAHTGLHEWLIERFLADIDALLLRGLRPQYLEREDNLSVLRGRLLPLQNLRVNTVAPHRFYCRFEELSLDRPEHRLIRTALHKIARRTQNPTSRRRAASLGERLHEVPISTDVARDFSAWRDDRLMLPYRRIRSSCEWILAERTAAPIRGHNEMFGCFARMHQLFERYVAKWLSAKYAKLYRIDVQKEKVFCRGPQGSEIMRPDILVKQGGTTLGIIDTKWKIGKDEGIARPDLYQMISYARFHFPPSDDGSGRFLGVIYPATADTDLPTRTLTFSEPMQDVPLYLQRFRLPRYRGDRWEEGLELQGIPKQGEHQAARNVPLEERIFDDLLRLMGLSKGKEPTVVYDENADPHEAWRQVERLLNQDPHPEIAIVDVLGHYFSNAGQVVVYRRPIRDCAQILEMPETDLERIVLAHELAHAATHLGTDWNGRIWEGFSAAASETKEYFAQLFAHVFLERAGSAECVRKMSELAERQSPPYRRYLVNLAKPLSRHQEELHRHRARTEKRCAFCKTNVATTTVARTDTWLMKEWSLPACTTCAPLNQQTWFT